MTILNRIGVNFNDFLEDQFKRIFSSYALSLNRQEKRTGSLFQKRFKRVSINSEYRLLYRLAYIHHNPIHHKFRKEYSDWAYSSYDDFLSDDLTFIKKDKVLAWFDENLGKRKSSFVRYHEVFKSNFQKENEDPPFTKP